MPFAKETTDFIPPQLWPPNSHDLISVDYHIWSILERRVYRTRIQDVDHVVKHWQKFDQKIIDWAIKQWQPRLQA